MAHHIAGLTAPFTAVISARSEAIHLGQHEHFRLPRVALRVHIIRGTAWLTSEGQDLVVLAGNQLDIPAQAFPAVISGLGGGSLTFEVVRA